MVCSPGAEIIAFPNSRLSTPHYTTGAAALGTTPAERLSESLLSLSAALAEQQQAIQRWRAAMAELAACMTRLSGDLDQARVPEPLSP